MAKKSLGQHWLFDRAALEKVVRAGAVTKRDVVLEVGPGLGTLTELLVERAKQVVAVEKDEALAADLSRRLSADNLAIVNDDILQFDLSQLPHGYKVVANIPYYLTSMLLRNFLEGVNPPKLMSLLVQKEVAERVTAQPGQMSVLAVSVQFYAAAQNYGTVSKSLFKPPPKVDSAILQLRRRHQPYFKAEPKRLFRLVKAGFSARRKQLKNTLAAGLLVTSEDSLRLLKGARIDQSRRAQELSLDDWHRLYELATQRGLV